MNMQERAESITNVRGKGTHCHVNDLLGWRSWKRMDFKTLFFSKFWNESFYGIFFPWHPCLLFSSHSDIINNYVTKRQSHFFVVPVSVFLFFFVLFCSFLFFFWSPCSFWWHFLIFFFFNLKHSRIYMKLESKRDPLKRNNNNNNNKIDIHRYLYFSTYLRVINK